MASKYRRGERGIWQLKWFDEHGKRRQLSTGTTDTRLAERLRIEKEREVAAREAGLIDDRTAALQRAERTPIETHIQSYLEHCTGIRHAPRRISDKTLHLKRAVSDMKVGSLSGFSVSKVRAWMYQLRDEGLAPRTVNEHRISLNALLNWCEKEGLLRENPIRHVAPLSTAGDKRRDRRGLTTSELERLFEVAQEQDRLNAGRGWAPRYPVYLTAVFTGLRHGELKKICWRDLDLEQGRLVVREEVGKARRFDEVALHPEVLSVLRELPRGEPMSAVFASVPTLGTFKKDCKRAGIVLRDDAGRTVDFHSFRMTLGTWLQREGVQPSLVQKIMRHASFDTTEKYYTDLRIHDLEQAVSQLRLPRAAVASEEQVATGTHGRASEECHQNCHHSVHETVRSGASGCESDVNHGSPSAHEKAPPGSGRADSSKRVRRFERPTFTLAT